MSLGPSLLLEPASLLGMVPGEADRRWIQNIARNLAFLADITPADLLIYCPTPEGKLMAVAEAKPTVRESFYRRSQLGQVLEPEAFPAVYEAFRTGEITTGPVGKVINGQPMDQVAYPMRQGSQVCGVLLVERNLYEELRHTEEKRHIYRTSIQRSVLTLLDRCRTDETQLPAIQAGDALLLVNDAGTIKHASHTAFNLARRMGLSENLEGLEWEEVLRPLGDRRLLASNALYEEQEVAGTSMSLAIRRLFLHPADQTVASILVLRDITEIKQKDRELAIKETIIREVHHRVKNNLQTIAGLLRLQQRRSTNSEVKSILSESIDRIASIALVHEYLSQDDVGAVDLKELAYNLLSASLQSMLDPEKQVEAKVICPSHAVRLPSAQATSMALVINELLQNTLKHAFKGRKKGKVELVLSSNSREVTVGIQDDGIGLPKDFSEESGNLGWQIIHTLARDDLRGQLSIKSTPMGTHVTVTIPVSERG